MSHGTEEWCKIWRKFGEFQCEQWQVWKFALWCATFVKSILCLTQKTTEELCIITLKKNAKFDLELTCALKNDMRNLKNVDPTLENLKTYTLMGSVWPTYKMFELKEYRGIMRYYTENHVLCVMTLKSDTIFKEKLNGGLKTDIRNLVNFHASSPKPKNVRFDWLVWSKACKVLDEKVQRSYFSLHWRVFQRKEKYTFFVWCNRFKAVSGRYSESVGNTFENCLRWSSFYS